MTTKENKPLLLINYRITTFLNKNLEDSSDFHYKMNIQEVKPKSFKTETQAILEPYDAVNIRNLLQGLDLTHSQKTDLKVKFNKKFPLDERFYFGINAEYTHIFMLFHNCNAVYRVSDKKLYVGKMNLAGFKKANATYNNSTVHNANAHILGYGKPESVLPIHDVESIKSESDYESELNKKTSEIKSVQTELAISEAKNETVHKLERDLEEEKAINEKLNVQIVEARTILKHAQEEVEYLKTKLLKNESQQKQLPNGRFKISSQLGLSYNIEAEEIKKQIEVVEEKIKESTEKVAVLTKQQRDKILVDNCTEYDDLLSELELN